MDKKIAPIDYAKKMQNRGRRVQIVQQIVVVAVLSYSAWLAIRHWFFF